MKKGIKHTCVSDTISNVKPRLGYYLNKEMPCVWSYKKVS